jgi:hypothetical protein
MMAQKSVNWLVKRTLKHVRFCLAHFPYFGKIKVGLCDHHAICMYICVSPPINVWRAELICMKLGMYIMAHVPISKAYFINPSNQPVCLHVYPPIVARQRLDINFTAATGTRNDRRIVGRVVFCAARGVSKENRRLVIPRTSCYLLNLLKLFEMTSSMFSAQLAALWYRT